MFDSDDKNISFNGWFYSWEDDREDDNIKRSHYLTGLDGRKVDMDFSPYNRNINEQEVRLFVEAGMPTRRQLGLSGPINKGHLEIFINARKASA